MVMAQFRAQLMTISLLARGEGALAQMQNEKTALGKLRQGGCCSVCDRCYFLSDPPNLQARLTRPAAVIVSDQSSVENVVPPNVIAHGWVGVISPEVPPSASPSQRVVLVGLVFVAPTQSAVTTRPEFDTRTEVGAKVLSTAPQVLSSATHSPVTLTPGAAAFAVVGRQIAKKNAKRPITTPPTRVTAR
jgi:hypothetical protein